LEQIFTSKAKLVPISSNFYFGTAILGPILKISAISEGPSLSKASGAHANG
jgi:hypothetical protein